MRLRNMRSPWRSLLAAIALSFACGTAAAFTHEVAEAELQQKLAAAMPVEIAKPGYTLHISDPEIDLGGAEDSVGIVAHVELRLPEVPGAAGLIALSGRLAYEPDSYSFFLRNIQVRRIEIENLREPMLPALKLVAQFAVARALAAHPIYVIKDDSLKARFARSFLKSVAVRDRKLILSMEIF